MLDGAWQVGFPTAGRNVCNSRIVPPGSQQECGTQTGANKIKTKIDWGYKACSKSIRECYCAELILW
jgi:hypothetical protein